MSSQPPTMPGAATSARLRRPVTRRITIAVVSIASMVAAIALSACSASSSSPPSSSSATSSSGKSTGASGGTFTIGIGVDLDTMDPAQQTTTTVQNVIDYGLQTLVTFNPAGQVVPMLATSWSTSSNGLALTFKLRSGVKFHDGTPFNADAVTYSLDRLINGKVKVSIGGAYTVIKSIDAVNPTTVTFNLKRPDPDLLPNLGVTVAAIFSPASVGKFGNTYTNIVHPVGTGPYEYVSRVRGSNVVYQRYAGYWGPEPYYSKVVFDIIPEASSREAGLRSGQLDLIMNPPVSDLSSLAATGTITVAKDPDDRSVFLAFNASKPPFNNVKVRQAFNYAINKDALMRSVLFNAVTPMDSPFPTSMPGHCTAGSYAYNPAKAKQLLKQAGATNLSVTLGSPTGRYLQDIQTAQAIAGYLSQVGVKVQVRTSDWPTYVSSIEDPNGPYNFHLLGWAPGANDPATQMEMFLKEDIPPAGLNTSFFSDPTVEALFAKANTNLDAASADQQYCQIQKALWTEAPWVFLWSQTLIIAYQSDIAGISYQPNEKFETINAHPKGA